MAPKARAKSASAKKGAITTLPTAKPKPVERFVHGERVVDDYAWLRASNWHDVMRDPSVLDPEIRAYLEAENRHSEKSFKRTAKLRKRLVDEIPRRIKEDDATVPLRGGRY